VGDDQIAALIGDVQLEEIYTRQAFACGYGVPWSYLQDKHHSPIFLARQKDNSILQSFDCAQSSCVPHVPDILCMVIQIEVGRLDGRPWLAYLQALHVQSLSDQSQR
jgi:hypothetical protein